MTWIRWASTIALGILVLTGLGDTPINETDEGFAANRATSFASSPSWMLSYDRVGETVPQFRKPQLLYWSVALAHRLLGVSEFATRLPVALASLGFCLVMVRFLRRYLDESLVWLGMLLFTAIPFALFHMRTAMLEMPWLFCAISAIHLLAHHPGRGPAALAGLAVGAACLIKGAAGLPVLAIAAVAAFLVRGAFWSCLRDLLVAALAVVLVVGLYFLAIPGPWRGQAWFAFLHQEGGRRQRWSIFGEGLAEQILNLRVGVGPILPAGLAGLLALLMSGRRRKILLLIALLGIPTLLIASVQVARYPRYCLLLYPLLSTLAVVAARRMSEGGAGVWLALPLAMVMALKPDLGGWATGGLVLGAWALGSLRHTQSLAWYRPFATWALAIGFLLPLWNSIAFAGIDPGTVIARFGSAAHPLLRQYRFNRPEILPIAHKVRELVPEGQDVLTAGRFRCHQLLFYGNRAIESVERWSMYGLMPGAERYVVQQGWNPIGIPHTRETELLRSGSFRLVRLQVLGDAAHIAGIFPGGEAGAAAQLTLAALGVGTQTNGDRLMALAPPARETSVLTRVPRYRLLRAGRAMTAEWDTVAPVCGIDVTACEVNPAFRGLLVEYRDAAGAWRTLGATEAEPLNFLDVEDRHLVRRDLPAFRIRGKPGPATGIRVTRTAGGALRVGELIVYVTPEPGSGTISGRAHE